MKNHCCNMLWAKFNLTKYAKSYKRKKSDLSSQMNPRLTNHANTTKYNPNLYLMRKKSLIF